MLTIGLPLRSVLPNWSGDAETSWLRRFARSVHSSTTVERWLAMIEVYGDLSGTKEGSVYLAACYIGTAESWVSVDVRWSAMLKYANVTHFHSTDFFADPPQGEFQGWNPKGLRYGRVEEMVTTAANAEGLIGFAWGLETAGFSVLRADMENTTGKQKIKSLRLLATLACFEGITKYLVEHPLPAGERIVARFEREKGGGEIPAYFKWCKKRRARWTRPFIDVTLGDKVERPLQVADLLAHQAWTRLKDVRRFGDYAPKRRPFARMAKPGRIKLDFMREEHAVRSLPNIQEFFAAFPEGIIAPPHPGRRP